MTTSKCSPEVTDPDVVVIFLPPSAEPATATTLRGVLATVPRPRAVLIAPSRSGRELHAGIPERQRDRLTYVDCPDDRPGSLLNAAARSDSGAEIVVVAESVMLPDGWLAGLREAAWEDDVVAAATAAGSGPGAPTFDEPDDTQWDADPKSSALHPRVLYPWAHGAWIRRSALELVGGFDESLEHPGAVLADFAARALRHGLSCTLADNLDLPYLEPGLPEWPPADRRALHARYPWLTTPGAQRGLLEPGPLRRALTAARARSAGLSATIDARALGSGVGGTQTYVGGLVLALARSADVSVRALVADDLSPDVAQELAGAGVELVTHEQVMSGVSRTTIVHRPQQVFSTADLRLLRMAGDRLVVSHMDLISYRSPTYHESVDAWRSYRRATRLALGVADRVVFFSEHTRNEAMAEELVESSRSAIAGVGIAPWADGAPARRPPAVPSDRDLLLVLGADYAHKNRPFAIALFDELRRRHGWDGLLVLAGAHQPYGSDAAAERELLRSRPDLAVGVIDLGPVSEPEKRWLMSAAGAHICASNYEGFGLAPLEARAAGRPCIYAPCTSLAETIDPAAATIIPWNAGASADAAAELLHAGPARERHLDLVGRALERYTWDRVVEDLLDCYGQAIRSPYPSAAPSIWHEIERDEVISGLEAARADLQARVAYGQSLVDRRSGLLTIAQQRGLMRVASRRWLRGPLLAPFGLLGADQRHGRADVRRPPPAQGSPDGNMQR